jgi:WD40 repeat protein
MPKPHESQKPGERGAPHEALEVFLGEWKAEGHAYAAGDQDSRDPKKNPTPWTSTHTARWHTGKFFLIQDERAQVAGPFDTVSIMGWDADTGSYFASSFENHGYYRLYDVRVDGKMWTFTGDTERARIEFSPDGRKQTIAWEWRPKDVWLPLCDRTATKT